MKNLIFLFLLLSMSHTNAASLNNFSATNDSISIQDTLENTPLISTKNFSISSDEAYKVSNNSPTDPVPTFVWFIASAILGLFGMKHMRGISEKSETA